MAARCLFLLALLILVVPAAAQERPDFSGRWTLLQSAGAINQIGQSLEVVQFVELHFTRLSVARTFRDGTVTENYSIGLVQGTLNADSRQISSGAKWDGDTLVLTAGEYPEGDWPNRRSKVVVERWSLQPEGRLLVETITSQTGTEPISSSAQYRRQ